MGWINDALISLTTHMFVDKDFYMDTGQLSQGGGD